jgi:hypothetical protein
MIGHLRQQALLGTTGANENFQSFAENFGADYLVVLKVTTSASRCLLSARWLDVRNVKALANEVGTCDPTSGGTLDEIQRISRKLVERAAYFEICPYKGPVKIKIHSSRTKEQKTEYPAFCNGMDQRYSKTETENSVMDLKLDLTRTGRTWATGTGHYSSAEIFELQEDDPCHDCGGGRRGVRLYTEKKRETAEIEGLSERSRAEASHLSEELQKVSDVRLYLRFTENGTYRLELLAASKTGTRRVHIERKAEGNCDTKIARPKEDYDVLADIGVAKIMGPFQGSPLDKSLTGNEEFRQKDSVTDEETTITVEFQLQRE